MKIDSKSQSESQMAKSFKYFKLKVPTDGLNPNTFLKLIQKKGGAIGDLNIITKVFI